MTIRTGSTVSLTIKEATGYGSQDVTYSPVVVQDVRDEYLSVDDAGSVKLYPWSSIRRLAVTTF